nr:glycosyltransferase [uncultured Bacillus sp.]
MKGVIDKNYPLVSILIPTYNRPLFFEDAINSVLQQTYPNIEIVIGDDSTNDRTENLIKDKYRKYSNITYIRNPRTLGQYENSINLFNKANGNYINYLMDDDLFLPEKIEKMMSYFLDDHKQEIVLVTSYRRLMNKDGNYLPDLNINTKLTETNSIISGKKVGNKILLESVNYIGEPTTALFRKEALTEPFGTLKNRIYSCTVDMASWILLLSKGKMVYITEPLSCFRIHGAQQLRESSMFADGIEDLFHLIMTAIDYGYLEKKEEQKKAYQSVLKLLLIALEQYEQRHAINYINQLLSCQRLVQEKLNTI